MAAFSSFIGLMPWLRNFKIMQIGKLGHLAHFERQSEFFIDNDSNRGSNEMGIPVLYLVKYHNDQKAAMVARPEMRDRAEVHKKAIMDFGGIPIAQFGSYGEWDMIYIYEMPDHIALAANLHLTDSLGLAKESKAIPLLKIEDFVGSLALADQTDTEYGSAIC
jgi:uncharacterized protein with GYD domain